MLALFAEFEKNSSTETGRATFTSVRVADILFRKLAGDVVGTIKAGQIDAATTQVNEPGVA